MYVRVPDAQCPYIMYILYLMCMYMFDVNMYMFDVNIFYLYD